MDNITVQFIVGADDEVVGEVRVGVVPREGEHVCLSDDEAEGGFCRYEVLSVTHIIVAGHLRHILVKVGHFVPSIEEIETILSEMSERNG